MPANRSITDQVLVLFWPRSWTEMEIVRIGLNSIGVSYVINAIYDIVWKPVGFYSFLFAFSTTPLYLFDLDMLFCTKNIILIKSVRVPRGSVGRVLH